jgi:ribonuclease HII
VKKKMHKFEESYWEKGFRYIAGIDEVGRGCLCGDVVAAAVILNREEPIEGIKDSKKLSAKRREQLYDEIMSRALAVAIGRIDSAMIDQINIKQATLKAMEQAVLGLKITPDLLLIDAERITSPIKQVSIIKGDDVSQSIAAASIIAKVTRDRLCLEWGADYPEFNIEQHKGYGTKEHIERLKEHGTTPIHRQSFIKNILK